MRLTPPMPLNPANVHVDAYDLALCIISIPHSSQLADLRWSKVSDVNMINHLTAAYTFQIPKDAKAARIGAGHEDGRGNGIERREHLVVRDLDLLLHLLEQNPGKFEDNPNVAKLGRIVAHADFRLSPKGWDRQDAKHPYPQANGTPTGSDSIAKPQGANVEFIELFDHKVEELLEFHCKDQECYELVDIATNASHLSKGLAKQLVTWLFPFCDEQKLDHKLLASPMGRGLYKACGFMEDGEGDKFAVRIDMADWNGNGIYEHVYMVRHPRERKIL